MQKYVIFSISKLFLTKISKKFLPILKRLSLHAEIIQGK